MRRVALPATAAALLLLCAPPATADTLVVDPSDPGAYPTILEAVFFARSGDVIQIAPGVYTGYGNQLIQVVNKSLTFTSAAGPDSTIIDFENDFGGFEISAPSPHSTVVRDLTFRNAPEDHIALLADQSPLEVTNCRFEGNYSAIEAPASPLEAHDCVFENNESAVKLSDAMLGTFVDCTFTDNSEALMVSNTYMDVEGCVFVGNYYGVEIEDSGHASVAACRIVGSRFGLRLEDTDASVADCEFEDNGDAFRLMHPHYATVDQCTFTGNLEGLGMNSLGAIWVTDCQFEGNGSGSRYDNTVSCHGGSISIQGCTFTGNRNGGQGGVILCWNGPYTISDCEFTGNSAAEEGGAIWFTSMYSPWSPNISGCTFTDNTAVRGGAIAGWRASANILDCEFNGNSAEFGGAVYVDNYYNGHPTIAGCTFTGNVADFGGGVYSFATSPRISNCTFTGNEGHVWGGGVCCSDFGGTPTPRVTGCVFDANRAHRGSCVALDATQMQVSSCTMVANRSDEAGVVGMRGSTVDVFTSVIAFNASGAPVAVQRSSGSLSTTVVFENADGDSLDGVTHYSNLFVDPLFCDLGSSDFTLCGNSPCLPGGNPWGALLGAEDVGCGSCSTTAEPTTWGAIKAMFR